MDFLSKLRISQRLALSYGLLIILLTIIGGYGAYSANRLAKDLDQTAKDSLVKIAAANALEEQVNVVARASRDLLLLDSAGAIKKQKTLIDGALQESEKQLTGLLSSPEAGRRSSRHGDTISPPGSVIGKRRSSR